VTHSSEMPANYRSLIYMCSLQTAADALIERANELDEQTLKDVIYSLRGELMMRDTHGVQPLGYHWWYSGWDGYDNVHVD